MLGTRSVRFDLVKGEHPYLDHAGRDSFDGLLATQRDHLFRDEDFATLYCLTNGRPSVPPSLLATALLLQGYDGVSDEEAKARADFDLRWKVALGIGLDERPFAKSTLQLFRVQLILHDQVRAVFQQSLAFARQTGYFLAPKTTAVLDTSYILGRGAVKDTYNLLADGIVKLVRALATVEERPPETWATVHELARYVGSSLKGAAAIDWDDPAAREAFPRDIVADADHLLDVARYMLADLPTEDPEHGRLRQAADLLLQLLAQDIERQPDGVRLKQGVSADRVVAVHDPEMRHGRKSATRRFDGHKGAIAVDAESQLILAAEVLPGNAQDHARALDLVEQAEANAEATVVEAIGDCAYGDSETRRAFADVGRPLVAKVPQRRGQAQLPKDEFQIDLATRTRVCPGGQATQTLASISSGGAMVRQACRCGPSASPPRCARPVRCAQPACAPARGGAGW